MSQTGVQGLGMFSLGAVDRYIVLGSGSRVRRSTARFVFLGVCLSEGVMRVGGFQVEQSSTNLMVTGAWVLVEGAV